MSSGEQMALRCIGLMVLRKPQFNYDELGLAGWPTQLQTVGDLLYGGVTRMGWFDFDEYYFREELTPELMALYRKVNDYGTLAFANLDLETLRDVDDVRRILEFLNTKNPGKNEVVAVSAPDLDAALGTVDAAVQSAEFLGWDVLGLSVGSLIYEGLFLADSLERCIEVRHCPPPEWVSRLNRAGLFPDAKSCHEFSDVYIEASRKGLVEVLLDERNLIVIRVWRVVL